MLLQMAIGVTLGAAAGYFGGVTDKVIMRMVDIIMCLSVFCHSSGSGRCDWRKYLESDSDYRNADVAGNCQNCQDGGAYHP